MGYILSFIIIVMTLYSIKWQKKTPLYLSIIVYFLLLAIIGFGYNLPDYNMYEGFYLASDKFRIENSFDYSESLRNGYSRDFGFTFLAYISNIFEFDFIEFRLLCYALGMLLIFMYAKKQTDMVLPFLCLYLFYPFAMDAIQFRNYLAEVFFFISLYCYTYSPKKQNLLYVVFICIAASFHSSALLFLPFLIFDKLLNTKMRSVIFVYLFICLLMPIYADQVQSNWSIFYYMLVDSDTSLSHYSMYAEQAVAGISLGRYLFVNIAMVIFFIIDNRISAMRQFSFLSALDKLYINRAKRLIMYNMCFFPLYPLFMDIANRFPRNSLLIIYMSIILCMKGTNQKQVYLLWVIGVFLALLYGFLDLYSAAYIHNVDILMNENYLFEFLGL